MAVNPCRYFTMPEPLKPLPDKGFKFEVSQNHFWLTFG